MIYQYHTIKRGEIVELEARKLKDGTTRPKRRRGTLDVMDPTGERVNFFTYTLRNYPSLQHARKTAKEWVDSQT
jgi:hypothetical protein